MMNEYFSFLDRLRASGTVNMFGAAPVLQEFFDLSRADARKILLEWMKQFGEER
jgi:hypothetical protein